MSDLSDLAAEAYVFLISFAQIAVLVSAPRPEIFFRDQYGYSSGSMEYPTKNVADCFPSDPGILQNSIHCYTLRKKGKL